MPAEDLVTFSCLDESRSIPLLAQPLESGLRLNDWAEGRREALQALLTEHGAVLFRGFAIGGQTEFEAAVECLVGRKLDYVYRTTMRTQVAKGVYTATDYPSRLTIPFHNENAYQRDWPMHLAFYCVKPAVEGGETPLANTVNVTGRIDSSIREEFQRKKVMYVRNYRPGVDIPWQTVFQTESKAELEAYCQRHGIACEWRASDWLQTRQLCHAMAMHPKTHQNIWFNQAHLFHGSNLEGRTRKALISLYGEEGLPRNAYFGDGTRIADEVCASIREAFQAESRVFPWQANDLLIIDNMLVAHSRNPFKGERKILVSMANPYSAIASA